MRLKLFGMVFVLAMGCGTMNGARPLDKDHHAVGVTFGGPMVFAFGTNIPLPNLVIEGRSGLSPLPKSTN